MNNSINPNQIYNKSIILKPSELDRTKFDLCYYVYNGKLTVIADYFNSLTENKCKEIVKLEKDNNNKKKSPLDIAAFLNFSNIFLFLLKYDSDANQVDSDGQSVWHTLCYKGHNKLLNILFNFESFNLKMQSLIEIDNFKKSFGFSKLDIIKGKLSRAVNLNEINKKKFESLQSKVKEEALNMIKRMLDKYNMAFSKKDKEGRNPLHYAAMSKFSLCYVTLSEILDFDLFKNNEWGEFLHIFQDIQNLEIKQETSIDPRRSLRIERELLNLIGDDIISQLSLQFKTLKGNLLKTIINTEDNNGDTALHIASFHGDYHIVNKLLAYGAEKTLKNTEGYMPVDMSKDDLVRKVLTNLNKAAKNSDEKNLVELVHFGHDINNKSTMFSQAPIHKIIESRSADKYNVLIKMLDMGADPNLRDYNGWTALHYSCQLGDLESVKILLQNKAEIDCFSNNNRTSLHLAAYSNYPMIVRLLLENKSDSNYKDNTGCTPLHLASKQGNIECINILLLFGANLYQEDFRKWNVLHYAAFYGHHKTVRFLSKYDADYDILQNSKNSQNKLPIEIVRDPSIKQYFMTLWHASKEGNLDMTRQLINDGENINELSTHMNNTPLHSAVLNNNYLLVRLLLSLNAVVDIRNKDGITPYEYAEIINFGINKYYSKCADPYKERVDLRKFVKNVINKNDKIVDCMISNKNKSMKLWNVQDFSQKICNSFQLKVKVKENRNNI